MPSAGLGRAKLLTLKQQQKDAELEANRQAVIKVREVRGLAPGRRVELGNCHSLVVMTRFCAGEGSEVHGSGKGKAIHNGFAPCVRKGIGQARCISDRGHSACPPLPQVC